MCCNTICGEDLGKKELKLSRLKVGGKCVRDVKSSSVCGVLDLAEMGSEHIHKLLDLRGSQLNCIQFFLRILEVVKVDRR